MSNLKKRIGIAKGVKVPDDNAALNAEIAELFIAKGRRTPARVKRGYAIARDLSAAFETGLKQAFAELDGPFAPRFAPRHYVDIMTTSSAELGRAFKAHLRDALWEAKRRKKK